MNRLTLAILTSVVAMFVVLMVFDIHQLFTTPLTPYGANHWVPELLAIFLIGRWLVAKFSAVTVLTIGICLALYSLLTYSLMNLVTLGIGTSSIFVGVFLMGVWTASHKKGEG